MRLSTYNNNNKKMVHNSVDHFISSRYTVQGVMVYEETTIMLFSFVNPSFPHFPIHAAFPTVSAECAARKISRKMAIRVLPRLSSGASQNNKLG